ncbi:MAG: hypothetical protein HY243_07015 [Proteobacteria bacterium]|nr:hypothetical protein [Pseudomonadota bacterium]
MLSDFALSRVYAAGWAAGSTLPSDQSGSLSEKEIDRLNPHKSGPAKARWRAGFDDALKR